MKEFLKTTIIGGALFLLPAALVLAILGPLENDRVAVFVPQAPTPMAGNVRYFASDRVRPLNMTMLQARAIVKNIGVGSATALRGANLSLPDA